MKPNFTKYPDGLVPVIIQDANTRAVLMLGYMNDVAWEKTQNEDVITFYSRSKQRLWTKGETSGNYLIKKQILLDCDHDCILILAEPQGAVCHTGSDTCFGESNCGNFLKQLEKIIEDRKLQRDSNSYTATLYAKGTSKIAQKVGEEAVELIIEAMQSNDEQFLNEAADLLFHYLVLLHQRNKNLEDVIKILHYRHSKTK
ncbi:MAG: bifunctional phosphoribosyl-AMP cyclohydrolase/phosphoribosyl-ATP diphosphatase HisIE [Flavobacteriales bacterium]|nr:bifunctional phosphoribosyl-AMP cyclohydrolase/phosphoribosyl-ATP diphosphatase HisIE [Flavobacteriales bacterium]